jgi:hypothetical protein
MVDGGKATFRAFSPHKMTTLQLLDSSSRELARFRICVSFVENGLMLLDPSHLKRLKSPYQTVLHSKTALKNCVRRIGIIIGAT